MWNAKALWAQMPFYTDNPDVTDRGTLHFEFFNEFDGLQSSQYPNLRQNTSNGKVNYGLPHNLELDFDIPYLSIYRASGSKASSGIGDADMGVKWNFYKASRPLSFPALASSLYIEFPTGNNRQELGSGLYDYWLNVIAQEPFTDKTRMTANVGFLFAGNTSTGALGIQTTRGHVFTGGLSLLHDFNPRLTLGSEIYGGIADNSGLGKDQIQGLVGGEYQLRDGLGITFAMLGGAHVASPRIGGQIGFEMNFPAILHRSPADKPSVR
jgi:outer membrane putative beta-barrel porin/alpha-amylase